MPTHPKEAALKKIIIVINQVFNYAMSKKLCTGNPAQFIVFRDFVKGCDLTKKLPEDRAFSDKDAERLQEDALKTPDNPRSLMRIFAKETGMRAAELSALHRSDIQGDFIHVHRQLIKDPTTKPQTYREVGYSKDERQHPHNGRLVPITPAMNDIIALAKALPGESDYLFHDKAGKAITPDSYEKHLRRACKKLGISTSNNHAFRVALNSQYIDKELSPSDRALLLGHSVDTNERHYSILDKRNLEAIRSKLQ